MLLTELLELPVHADDGARLGYVNDVRFVLAGPPDGRLARAELYGLVVSPHRRGSFLGYERHDVDAPALINVFLRRRHAGSVLVLWTDVVGLGPDGVRLADGARRYDAAL
ncbi:PRC-barrel domain-containing protein [Georgenia subflava]|uniref:PRC-barrel domain containing protein n=1 Tax=Georgenia subflava TaxID=1622177 RepID=A0A6N7EFJ1_9MICO|nr:PRC-barrel domain containing protein [Georgenia subflava]MPV35465.1 PRC-barrel domain containing protein [Georgenia subflava]